MTQPSLLVDSHCHLDHLDLEPYDGCLEKLLADTAARGVSRVLTVGIDLESSRQQLAMSAQLPGVYASVGVHPMNAESHSLPTVVELSELAQSERVIAIGETGLDRTYGADTMDWQRESFIRHAEVARACAKPLIIHTRDAQQETLAMIDEHVDPATAGVLHCFTESWEMAEAALAMNFYLSFSGIVTFKNAAALREVVAKVPLDRLLVETDSPWLAPVPYRGKKNEPRFVVEVAQCVADIKGIPFETLAQASSDNFDRLFLRT